MRQRWLVAVSLAALAGFGLGACGGGGGGGGAAAVLLPVNPASGAAVDATLSTLGANLRAGATNLDAAITEGTVANPNPQSPPTTITSNLFGLSNDGTVKSVTVETTEVQLPDGSATSTIVVKEATTGFEFSRATVSWNAPAVSFRNAPYAGIGVDAAGNGSFHVFARIDYTGTVTRMFANTSPTTGATLVKLGGSDPVPPATATSDFTRSWDVLFEYRLSVTGGLPRATIRSWQQGSGVLTLVRRGGPSTTPIVHAFGKLNIGAVAIDATRDDFVAIGGDALKPGGATQSVATNAPVDILLNVSGGILGASTSTSIARGNLLARGSGTVATSTVPLTTTLAGVSGADNGILETDLITMGSTQREHPVPSFSHTATTLLTGPFIRDMEQLVYLANQVDRGTAVFCYK